MAEQGIQVDGITSVINALRKFDAEAVVALREELRTAGGKVRDEAQQRFDPYNAQTALGYRVYVRGGSRVDVEQSIGRTTGTRPDFGALQMRIALIPSLGDKQDEVFADVEAALNRLADRI